MKRSSSIHQESSEQVLTRRALGFITALSLVLGALSWTSFSWSKNELFSYRDLSTVEEELPMVKLEEPKLSKPPKPKTFLIISPDPDPDPEPRPEPDPQPDPEPGFDPDPFVDHNGIDDGFRDTADDETPFTIVEHMPAVPGCEHLRGPERDRCTELAILQHLSQHARFPRRLMDLYNSGSVYLSFVIGKDGRVKDLTILRESHPLFGQEVMKAAQTLPVFTPGEQQGRKVPVQYVVPVSFKKS
jgi:protein TonB